MKKANLPVRAEWWENGRKGSVEEKERRRGRRRGGVSAYERGELRERSKRSV